VPVTIEVDTHRRQKRCHVETRAPHTTWGIVARSERAECSRPQAARDADFLLQNGDSLDELADRLLRSGEH
jgi:hypothetical protein